MEAAFREIALYVALVAEAGAVSIVAFGILQASIALLKFGLGPRDGRRTRKDIWLGLGVWLLLGLEFELAADIVRSIFSPTWADVGKLAAIAAVRTFLNYFLEKDLEKYAAPDRRTAEIKAA